MDCIASLLYIQIYLPVSCTISGQDLIHWHIWTSKPSKPPDALLRRRICCNWSRFEKVFSILLLLKVSLSSLPNLFINQIGEYLKPLYIMCHFEQSVFSLCGSNKYRTSLDLFIVTIVDNCNESVVLSLREVRNITWYWKSTFARSAMESSNRIAIVAVGAEGISPLPSVFTSRSNSRIELTRMSGHISQAQSIMWEAQYSLIICTLTFPTLAMPIIFPHSLYHAHKLIRQL